MPSRILIADDHDLIRLLIKRKLEDHADWVCIEAENGEQAVAKASLYGKMRQRLGCTSLYG